MLPRGSLSTDLDEAEYKLKQAKSAISQGIRGSYNVTLLYKNIIVNFLSKSLSN